MKQTASCGIPGWRNIEVMLKKHLSGGLAQHNQCHSYKGMYEHRHAVYGVKFVCTAAPAYLIRQIALHGYGHRTIDKSKQGHYACHHIIDAKVLNTEHFKYHTRGVKRHECLEQHAHVKKQRVFGYAFVV